MKVTIKGQVTIPQHIREKLGIQPSSEVDFIEDGKRVYLVKNNENSKESNRFSQLRGVATVRMTTDEVMKLTRSDR
jgi:AbrB family looped-hinge helix DNA binding protein